MTVQKSINLALAGFLALFGAAFMLLTLSASAQEGDTQEAVPVTTEGVEITTEPTESTDTETTEEEATVTTEETSSESFDYVAQPGDSYSLMARKAIQTYGVNNSVNLSGAQIIFAETNMTIEAGSPVLTLGQTVSINESTVKQWIESAQELTEEQQAMWQPYANNANFNTNAVGQSQE